MSNGASESIEPNKDTPRRLRDHDVAARYGVSRRTGAEWLRAMVAAGIVRKLRAMFVGRWSAVDTWVESGGQTKRVGGRLRDAVCAAGAQ